MYFKQDQKSKIKPYVKRGFICILCFLVAFCSNPGSDSNDDSRVATPSFSPSGGEVSAIDVLTIGTATPEATIYYTTDGSEPNNPMADSDTRREYIFPIGFDRMRAGERTYTITIKAIAVKAGLDNSEVVEATFDVSEWDIDADDDGLIEIRNLNMLSNIRYDLAGASYKTSDSDPGTTNGAPITEPPNCDDGNDMTTITLCGYELMQGLDFAVAAHYASGNVNDDWRPNSSDPGRATNEGFDGLGAETGATNGFTGIFEGNDHTIGNLYSRNNAMTGKNIGLFRLVSSGGVVRNVGVTDVRIYGGERVDIIGGLVGRNYGDITASHSAGIADGENGSDQVGGLVGYAEGKITASYSSVVVDGEGGIDYVGGLVGENYSAITASYATGDSDGGDGGSDSVGGAWWDIMTEKLRPAIATGDPSGGIGNSDYVGGLVGENIGPITASYATGDPDGGDGGQRSHRWLGRVQ